MAKLTRVTQKVFGLTGSSSHFGQFGSKAAGVPVPTLDPASIQALAAFTGNGCVDAVVSANKQPFLEDMNGLFRVIFYQLAQIFQDGNPVWDAGTTYYTGSVVRKDGTFELYGSLTDNNLGNALPNQTSNGNWTYLNPASVQPGIMVDFGGTVAPFGYLLCDGSVYAQASYPNLYAAIGTNWNTGGEGGGNFRVPDIRGRASIGAGAGSGLTNRTVGQEFGEETHVLTSGEMPVHNHPVNISPSNATVGTGTATIAGASPGNFLPAGSAQGLGISTANTGGGGAHNNMQPSAVVLKIIKT